MALILRDRTSYLLDTLNKSINRGFQLGFNTALEEDLRKKRMKDELQFALEKAEKLSDLQNRLRKERLKEKEQALFSIFKEDIKKDPTLAKQIQASLYGFKLPKSAKNRVKYFTKIDVGDKVIPMLIFEDGTVKMGSEFVKKLSPTDKYKLSIKTAELEEKARHNRATEGLKLKGLDIRKMGIDIRRQLGLTKIGLDKQKMDLTREKMDLTRQKLDLAKQKLNLMKKKLTIPNLSRRTSSRVRSSKAVKKSKDFNKYLNTYISLEKKISTLQAKDDLLGEEKRQKAIERLTRQQQRIENLMKQTDPERYRIFKGSQQNQQPTKFISAQPSQKARRSNPLLIFER